ncbi:ParB-like nuclease domain-containing protein [Streptomyces sp. SolWspMP-5a-2]|nr:ParB-like nuclease domain-containing protein [Streptomyces sp. SolWspMP-5a-2]
MFPAHMASLQCISAPDECMVERPETHSSAPPEKRESDRGAIETIATDALLPADSPRTAGLDEDHVRALADVLESLPPLLVERNSLRVIDGMHRLLAARLKGHEHVRVEFYDGDADQAFLHSVRINVRHGLPLTRADRRAAAERLFRTHPQLSDRAIAAIAGLATKTVARLRLTLVGCSSSDVRVGQDGRRRPVNNADGRLAASRVIALRPEASLREIAREAGISVGTAHDVKERIRQGRDPLPDGVREKTLEIAPAPADDTRHPAAPAEPPERTVAQDMQEVLQRLRQDPSLRYTESGRSLLRWLGTSTVIPAELPVPLKQVPAHCAVNVSRLARSCAAAWLELALHLESGTTR